MSYVCSKHRFCWFVWSLTWSSGLLLQVKVKVVDPVAT